MSFDINQDSRHPTGAHSGALAPRGVRVVNKATRVGLETRLDAQDTDEALYNFGTGLVGIGSGTIEIDLKYGNT